MKNVVFRESEFVKVPFSITGGTTLERVYFLHRMDQWISRFPGNSINRFEIYFPTPYGFQETIDSIVEIALSKRVKILVLDFSNESTDAYDHRTVIRLPGCVYDQTKIESLKLISCSVDCTKFKNSTVLRSLTIGRVELKNLTTLLSNFPSLESLRFKRCQSLDHDVMITHSRRLTELVFADCDFSPSNCTLNELPQVMIFECSGTLPSFTFHGVVNERMQEAELNFWLEEERGYGTGVDLGKLLNGVSTAKTLNVDSFLLQMIPSDEEELLPRFGTRHLEMLTNLHPDEYIGIRLMIDKCPALESLTFDIVSEKTIIILEETVLVPEDFNADTYWLGEITHECLEKTLKVVVVKDFGNMYELQILSYLIKYGLVLERLELYMSEDQKPRIEMALKNVPRGSSRLQITLHSA